LPGDGVRISQELRDELLRQPPDVVGEFEAICEKLERLAASRRAGQIELPGVACGRDHPRTRCFGVNGAILHQTLDDGQVVIVDVDWPTEVDSDTREGQPPPDCS
jgi:hypothetical protein